MESGSGAGGGRGLAGPPKIDRRLPRRSGGCGSTAGFHELGPALALLVVKPLAAAARPPAPIAPNEFVPYAGDAFDSEPHFRPCPCPFPSPGFGRATERTMGLRSNLAFGSFVLFVVALRDGEVPGLRASSLGDDVRVSSDGDLLWFVRPSADKEWESKYESGAGNVNSRMLELGDKVDVFQRGSSSSEATGCVVLCTMFCNNSTARECTCDSDCKCFVVSD